ncbi:hypothetical protein CJU94_13385 [Paraburkholderia aromaticivorans]|uniref:Uncharacterized protein n=1 Tax=Paraburkholderia aromaticivorans TaxID=2026199 RepID=A0A248VJ30_9BURK|nr:hypothetical protein CJU94_13385 [Paraburkholderia aromaticivorans]
MVWRARRWMTSQKIFLESSAKLTFIKRLKDRDEKCASHGKAVHPAARYCRGPKCDLEQTDPDQLTSLREVT